MAHRAAARAAAVGVRCGTAEATHCAVAAWAGQVTRRAVKVDARIVHHAWFVSQAVLLRDRGVVDRRGFECFQRVMCRCTLGGGMNRFFRVRIVADIR